MFDEGEHARIVKLVSSMVFNRKAQELVRQAKLDLANVTWEDTGRYKGSAVGPNITDVTLQIQYEDLPGRKALAAMPVIRYPNFADLSGDIPLEKLFLLAGNERPGCGSPQLTRLSLEDYLANLTTHLSHPGRGKVKGSLLHERDTHVLASAQACFLPIPKENKATFNVVAFNYQSCAGNPAVLTVLATREGTSATIIDNVRDPFDAGMTWGQRLFFNQHGERCSLEAERLSDFTAREERQLGFSTTPAKGLDMVMLIQVPLVHRPIPPSMPEGALCGMGSMGGMELESLSCEVDVESAVLSHGAVEGPFTELDGLEIERDARFPIRVTVQFYKATSNGDIDQAVVQEIKRSIERVYADADFVGSLVTEGETTRVTEHGHPDRTEPPGWWAAFWTRYWQSHAHVTPAQLEKRLQELFGDRWRGFSAEEVERVRLSGRLDF